MVVGKNGNSVVRARGEQGRAALPGQDVWPGTVPGAGGSLGSWLVVGPDGLLPQVTMALPGLSKVPHTFILELSPFVAP